jgi:hypothetical protein
MAAFEHVPPADDGREPFPVDTDTAAVEDAPDGAVAELSAAGQPGWWQRQGRWWQPVTVTINDRPLEVDDD